MSPARIAIFAALPLLCASVAVAEPAAGQWEHHHQIDPKRVCVEHYAHHAAKFAYLEAKLNLTAAQRPAWTKWQEAVLSGAAKGRDACLEGAAKAPTPSSLPDREAAAEKFLTLRLQALKETRPLLVAVYDQLTADQKAVFDQSGHRHGHDFGHWHGEAR